MKLLCITDIHQRMTHVEKLVSDDPSCDVVIVAGDITNFGGAKEAAIILGALSKIGGDLLVVPGNCDKYGVNDYLAESGFGIHGGGRVIADVGFFGVGGSNLTPFGTPQEYSEDDINGLLVKGYEKVAESDVKVLVSHPPPYSTDLDRTSAGQHVGSRSVRHFLDGHEIDLVVTGHVHESKGVTKIEKTTLLNPGPLPTGYAIVEIGEGDVEIEFHVL
jgi:hypothetical protein